jgi:hypothetical protein
MVKGLLLCAVLLALTFLVCHIAGFREATAVLSGTYSGADSAVAGLLYAVFSLVLYIFGPILVLGAGLTTLFERMSLLLGSRRARID